MALNLFRFGQAEAASRGLILVDTKYEFGKTADGAILLIDEIHTPDSSRQMLYLQRLQYVMQSCTLLHVKLFTFKSAHAKISKDLDSVLA